MEKKGKRAFYVGKGKPGETPPLVSVEYEKAMEDYENDLKVKNYNSLLDPFLDCVKRYPKNKCFGQRNIKEESKEYVWKNYEEVAELLVCLARGIEHYKLYSVVIEEGRTRKILGTMVAQIREELVFLNMALWHIGASLMCETDEYKSLTEIKILAASDNDLPKLFDYKERGILPHISTLILFDPANSETKAFAKKHGIVLYTFSELIAKGREQSDIPLPGSRRDDLAVILDTSGTTGFDKSVMQTHDLCLYYIYYIFSKKFTSGAIIQLYEECYACPTMICIYGVLSVGSGCAMKSHIYSIFDDIQYSQPNYLCLYSSQYQVGYRTVMEYISNLPAETKRTIETALEEKIKFVQEGKGAVCSHLDKILAPLREMLFGKKIEILFTAGAPLPPRIFDTLKAIGGVTFENVYGQTELGILSFGATNDLPTCLGPPCPLRMFKLIDVPKLGYLTSHTINGVPAPRGELLVYKPTFLGYFQDPELTASKIEKDGWYHTGDICTFLEDGAVSIIERMGNIMKNSMGEFISPEKLETIYGESEYVEQICVLASNYHDFVVAIIYPNGKKVNPNPSVLKHDEKKEICESILEDLGNIAKKHYFKHYEVVKAIHLASFPFTQENMQLTRTAKKRRRVIKEKYEKEIEGLFSISFK